MESEFDVVLLPTFAQVEDWRKREANNVARGLFSQAVTTFSAWIADLWGLYGNGRVLIDPLQRSVVMQAAFEQLSADGQQLAFGEKASGALTLSPGVMSLASACASAAAGVPAFEEAVGLAAAGVVPEALSVREASFLAAVGRYFRLIEEIGLVELGQAAAWLAEHQDRVFSRPVKVLIQDSPPLSWIQESFFASCDRLTVEVRYAPSGVGAEHMPSEVALGFGFPSGRYAQPGLVADLVKRAVSNKATDEHAFVAVVTAKDPLSLYQQLEEPLSKAGLRVGVQAQVPFSSTDFGRQFLEMARVLADDTWSPSDLSDAVRPPFSGFSASDALVIDKTLRADRLSKLEDCLARLRVASDVFSQLEELASDPEADILLGVFEQIAFTAPGRSAAWRYEQLAAAAALRSCTSAARRVGMGIKGCMSVLQDAKIGVSFEGAQAGAGQNRRAIVTTQQAAAQMGVGSCDILLMCDLTSQDYPVADKDDAGTTLFDKLGLHSADSALGRARRAFAALQHLPTSKLFCIRPLNDWDGNPAYPCAVLQEFVDSYSDGDVDELFGLPGVLRSCSVQRGEELLIPNAYAASPDFRQGVWGVSQPDWESPGSSAARSLVALPRRGEKGRVVAEFSPSPSQVEAYLECPRKWFVQSRLNVEGLDEGFGPLERGSFSHSAMQAFYQRFQQGGSLKVLPDNLEAAKGLMREVAAELAAAQYDLEPGSGRYVAVDQLEQRQVQACIEDLVSYLDFECQFLPGFHPAYFEYAFGPQDGAVYAGRPFIGIADRIDVDGAGNAVVIDYKGSVGKAHQIAGKSESVPGKVQARMYAQVVKRTLGLNVVGALYVSYGKTHACAGSFDPRALQTGHLPFTKVEQSSCAAHDPQDAQPVEELAALTFASMLDRTEQIVGRAIRAMEAGEVAARPSAPESCTYCPVETCPIKSK